MKYEYAIQQKWRGSKRWNTKKYFDMHFDSIKKAKEVLINHKKNYKHYESRIIKRAVGKWEVVK